MTTKKPYKTPEQVKKFNLNIWVNQFQLDEINISWKEYCKTNDPLPRSEFIRRKLMRSI